MTVLIFIATLVVLILIHELGHFIAAKIFKVKVEEFGIGYPPRAFRLFKLGDTEYTLNWLPFGGFVKLLGENATKDNDKSEEYKEKSLENKHPAKQIIILFAGVFMNFVFAWGLFSYVFYSGVPLFWDRNYQDNSELILNGILQNSPADIAGLQEGDIIKDIYTKDSKEKGENVDLLPYTVSGFILSNLGKNITIKYLDKTDDIIKTTEVVPAQGILKEYPEAPAIGISMTMVAKDKVNIVDAIVLGLKTSITVVQDVAKGLGKLFADSATGNANLKNVAGPVGIAGMVSSAASVGFAYLLYFTALISVNLAVINLIPIPALDGGRILFVTIEWITRRKIPATFTGLLNFVGFALLIILMLVVTYNDIVKLFTSQ